MALRSIDLMIGDWLLFEGEPIQVSSFDDKYVRFGLGEYKIWRFEPIPITPEILEKNGFKEILFDENGKESDNGYPSEIYRYDTARSGYIIELGIYSPNCICIQWKEFGIDGWETGELASFVKKDGSNYMVHELQHAMRLCGIDKEIIL